MVFSKFGLRAICTVAAMSATYAHAAGRKLVLIGDSTVAVNGHTEKVGWGASFAQYLDPSRMNVENDARGGTSSKTFYMSQDWQRAVESGGKYLLIQFGHNDQSADPRRNTSAEGSYKAFLRLFVEEARAAGMTPILVTPLRRVNFDAQGHSVSTLGDYAEAMKSVGVEMDVKVIDLHRLSGEQYEAWGPARTPEFFVNEDSTHTNAEGSKVIAGLVARELALILPESRNWILSSAFAAR